MKASEAGLGPRRPGRRSCLRMATKNPMKPHRISDAHNLIQAYGLDKQMDVHGPKHATTALTSSVPSARMDTLTFSAQLPPEAVAILAEDLAKHLVDA
ncbi:hypothetical protein CF319_g362 [Tilletia indica]|nr:hypothetical protein CF319_g362 [Tilletia indica]